MQSIGWWSTLVFSAFLLCFLLPCDLGFRIFTRISLLGRMNPSGLSGGQRWLFGGVVAGSILVFVYPFLFLLGHEPPGTVPLFRSVAAEVVGLICLASGTMLSGRAIAQLAAVNLWREADDHLITSGAYGRVRNPIYLGLTLGFIGVWLVRPTVILLLALACYVTCNHWRIHLEERYLQLRFGEEFRRYCSRVGRYLPRSAPPQQIEIRSHTRDDVTRETLP